MGVVATASVKVLQEQSKIKKMVRVRITLLKDDMEIDYKNKNSYVIYSSIEEC